MFGDSLFGLRVVPALIASGVVVAAAAVATELGGGRTAAAVAAWATASTATVLALGHMLTTPTVDVLVWTTAIWVLCRIVRTHDGRWLLLLGAIVGVGLLNKFTVLLAVASFGAALAMLPQRRVLAVTALLVLPILPATIVVDSPASAVNPEPLEMIGWPQFVDRIADEYERIDDGTRTAVILTGNYGEAGAIDRFGPDRGLPPAYSGHNSYADFRQPPGSAGPVLVVGYRAPGAFLVGCRELDPIVMPDDVDNEEQGALLWSCDAPSRPWNELWPDIRHID